MTLPGKLETWLGLGVFVLIALACCAGGFQSGSGQATCFERGLNYEGIQRGQAHNGVICVDANGAQTIILPLRGPRDALR